MSGRLIFSANLVAAIAALACACKSGAGSGSTSLADAARNDASGDAANVVDASLVDALADANGIVDARVEAEPDSAGKPDACVHPEVKPDCTNGWCRIPPGCYVHGSPHSEWGRGKYSEEQVQITLTHAFLIQQREMSRSAWVAIDPKDPTVDSDFLVNCQEPACPASGVTWFMALELANKASAKHDPPLAPCYKLTGCGYSDSGDPSHFWECTGVEATAKTVYDCEGFRLPTEAEWEYAARAGTTTTFYSGDITYYENVYDPCVLPEPKLDEIAWTCLNSGDHWPRKLHPGGTKQPNGWGLHDMLGSVEEWVNDSFNGLSHGSEPLTDPFGIPEPGGIGQTRGGSGIAWSTVCRIAYHQQAPKYGMAATSGLRLVRTIP